MEVRLGSSLNYTCSYSVQYFELHDKLFPYIDKLLAQVKSFGSIVSSITIDSIAHCGYS